MFFNPGSTEPRGSSNSWQGSLKMQVVVLIQTFKLCQVMIIVPEVPRLKKRLKTLIYVDKEQYHICILTVALVSKKKSSDLRSSLTLWKEGWDWKLTEAAHCCLLCLQKKKKEYIVILKTVTSKTKNINNIPRKIPRLKRELLMSSK